MSDESFFFFRVVDGRPEVYPVTTATRRMVLDGTAYMLIELPGAHAAVEKRPVGRSRKATQPDTRPRPAIEAGRWPLDRIRSYLEEAGRHGLSPLEIRTRLDDVWPVPLGPILSALMKAGEAERLSDGNWAIKDRN